MPDPNPSNRERLLRLIDGGTEALKEMQPETAAPVAAKKTVSPWTSARLVLAAWRAKLPAVPGAERLHLGRWLIGLVALIAVLHYGLEMFKTMKPAARPEAASSAASAVTEEESGTGLRLVGVDTSDASPVALLEDIQTGKTYFARKNEKVRGVRVKQIQKNKVTVSYQGKNVELR